MGYSHLGGVQDGLEAGVLFGSREFFRGKCPVKLFI